MVIDELVAEKRGMGGQEEREAVFLTAPGNFLEKVEPRFYAANVFGAEAQSRLQKEVNYSTRSAAARDLPISA